MATARRWGALTWVAVVLFSVVYANLAWLLGASVIAGAALGALLGALPTALGDADAPRTQRLAYGLGLLSLVAVAVVVMGFGLLAVFGSGPAATQKSAPLFIAALALYAYCMHHERQRNDAKPTRSLTDAISQATAAPSFVATLSVAVILSAYLLFLLWFASQRMPAADWLTDKFLERGIIPPLTLLLFCWGLLLLANKWIRARGSLRTLPWMLGAPRVRPMLDENLLLAYQKSEEGYLIPRYIGWAIPILGFVGTVLGISLASAGIQRIIGSSEGLGALSDSIGEAIAPLGIAFDTTLIALSLSLVLTLLQTLLHRWEEARYAEMAHALRVKDSPAP